MASMLPNPTDCCDDCSCASCTPVEITVVTGTSELVFDTIAEMKAYNPLVFVDEVTVTVLGELAAYDGSGGRYVYDIDSALPDDTISIIQPTAVAGNGRWIKLL